METLLYYIIEFFGTILSRFILNKTLEEHVQLSFSLLPIYCIQYPLFYIIYVYISTLCSPLIYNAFYNERYFGYRCNDDVELFHNIEWIQIDTASGLQFNSNERLGRGVHVFYIRVTPRVRVCELRRSEEASAQRRI